MYIYVHTHTTWKWDSNDSVTVESMITMPVLYLTCSDHQLLLQRPCLYVLVISFKFYNMVGRCFQRKKETSAWKNHSYERTSGNAIYHLQGCEQTLGKFFKKFIDQLLCLHLNQKMKTSGSAVLRVASGRHCLFIDHHPSSQGSREKQSQRYVYTYTCMYSF